MYVQQAAYDNVARLPTAPGRKGSLGAGTAQKVYQISSRSSPGSREMPSQGTLDGALTTTTDYKSSGRALDVQKSTSKTESVAKRPKLAERSQAPPTWLAPQVFATAVSRLQSAVGEPCSWCAVGSALTGLLDRYTSGLTLPTVIDDVESALAPAERPKYFSSRIWRGVVCALQRSPQVPAWVVEGTSGGPRLFGVFEHPFQGSIGVREGVKVRLRPKELPQDPSGCPGVWKLGEIERQRKEETGVLVDRSSKNQGNNVWHCSLPTQAVAFEIMLPLASSRNSDGARPSEFPADAERLLQTQTLQHVWDTRNGSPEWVSGKAVEVKQGKVFLRDIDAVGTGQPCVPLILEDELTAVASLVDVGECVLLKAPAVYPTEDSFCLKFAAETVLFVLPAQLEPVALTVLPPPPKSAPASSTPSVARVTGKDESLAESKSPVLISRIGALLKPELQTPFSALGVAAAPPVVDSNSAPQSAASASLALEGGISVHFRAANVQQLAVVREFGTVKAGDGVWLSNLVLVADDDNDDGASWYAASLTNVSRMAGFLNSPALHST